MWIMSTFLQSLGLGIVGSQRSDYRKEFNLPNDIIIQILSRLPVKTLLRFKCACKSWAAILEDRGFIEQHMYQNMNELVYDYQDVTSFKPLISSIDDGLVLEQGYLTTHRLRNPATRQVLDLPDPELYAETLSRCLAYVPTINSYKLVRVFSMDGTRIGGCEVLVPGIDHAWRNIDTPSFCDLVRYGSYGGSFLRSSVVKDVYFVTSFFLSNGHVVCDKLAYLELGTECSGTVKIPPYICSNCWDVRLLPWKYKLALSSYVDDQELHFWILEDYKKQKWAERKIVISLTFINQYPIKPKPTLPLCVTDDHWLWFRLDEDFHLRYNIESQEVHFKTPPSGKKFSCFCRPSLVSLPGFQPEPNKTIRIIVEFFIQLLIELSGNSHPL